MNKKENPGRLAKKKGNYYAVLYLTDKNGKHTEKWISLGMKTRGNSRRAQRALEELKSEYAAKGEAYFEYGKGKNEGAGKYAPKHVPQTQTGDILFSQFIQKWLESAKPRLEPTTYAGYKKWIDGVICPYFDEMKITVKELSAADLEAFYRKAQRTRSPNTVIKFHANIRESLQWGIRHGYVLTNVADVAEKPKKESFLPHFYNLDKMKKLLDEVRGTQLEFAVVMACHYGLRREEIVGLKWDAIDFQYKQIEIKHIVTEAVVDGHYQQISLDRAKTEKSLRTLPLLPSVEDLLLRMKTQQEDFEKIYGARYDHSFDGYIYLWPNGKRVKPMWVTHAFHRFLKETDPDNLIRFHDLRHSCATLMRHEGVPMEDIQKWLGHSTIVTTEGIYAHFDENGNIGSANKLAGAFGEKDVEDPKPSGDEMK